MANATNMVLKTEDGVGELPNRLYLHSGNGARLASFKLAELYAYTPRVTTEAGCSKRPEYQVVCRVWGIQCPGSRMRATSPQRTDVLMLFGRLCELTQGICYDYLDRGQTSWGSVLIVQQFMCL